MNRYLYRITLILCLSCLAAVPVQAGSPALEAELQGVIDEFLAENSIAPGISACVICPGMHLDWSGVAGTAAKDDPAPMTPAHTFRIASNTKTYVAASILRLVEMGRLGLDDGLSGHLMPEVNELLKSDGYDTDVITIAQVLSHTAGIGDHTNDSLFVERIFNDNQHVWTPEEQIQCLVEWREPVGEPGEKYIYSDAGYIILGTIISRMTGKTLGPSVRELLDFKKLGLEVTYWEYMEEPPAQAGPRAHQYFGEVDVTTWNASFDLYGGGGIVTDSRELALFMRRLLKGEVLADESTLAAMTSGGTEPYRLGLIVLDCDGHEAFGHQGFWNTLAYHVPSLDLTVSGCILNHDAANGSELLFRLVSTVATAAENGE